MSNINNNAKSLRKNLTEAEKLLWKHLRDKNIANVKFRRQQAIGIYIVDFISFDRKIIVKADGGQHLDSETDKERDEWLKMHGFKVLRFWNNEILTNLDGVLDIIRNVCLDTPHPNPLPQGERGLISDTLTQVGRGD